MSELSMANQAAATQGGEKSAYPGHDRFQNGVLTRDNPQIYMAGWSQDWGSTGGSSGYFTDKATIDSCVHDGVLNTNELDGKIQTQLSTKYGDAEAHSNVSAYDVDFDRLDQLKEDNPDLYNKLTAPDGKPTGEIKVAYGEVSANKQHGPGGGHQYYINPETFREALKEGVFKYNPDESYSADRSSGLKPIERTSIDKGEYEKKMRDLKKIYKPEHDKIRHELENEQKLKGITKEAQNDSYEVDTRNEDYIAKPDKSYDYRNAQKASESLTKEKVKIAQEQAVNAKRAVARAGGRTL
jgi:hypothetical protein